MTDVWLTLPQAAARLGRSPQTIRRWIRAGTLPAELRPGTYGLQYFVHDDAVKTRQPTEARQRDDELRMRLDALSERLQLVTVQLEVLQRSNAEISQFAESIVGLLQSFQQQGLDRSRWAVKRQAGEVQRSEPQPAPSVGGEPGAIGETREASSG